MLNRLYINNFITIEEIDVNFFLKDSLQLLGKQVQVNLLF